MKNLTLGLVAVVILLGAGVASACPPCTQQWLGTKSCTPADYCYYCCYRTDQCFLPETCESPDLGPGSSQDLVSFVAAEAEPFLSLQSSKEQVSELASPAPEALPEEPLAAPPSS